MPGAADARKEELVDQAEALLGDVADRLGSARPAALHRFIAELYRHVPPADLAGRSPAELAAAALSLWHLAAERRPGAPKIRLLACDKACGGEERGATPGWVVEIVNDDMPFLVDSTIAAIHRYNRAIRLVMHPVLDVSRDESGALLDIGSPAALRESWMRVELVEARSDGESDALRDTIARALADVRSAVRDWPAMRQALRSLVAELSGNSSVGSAERDEVVAFLRWLDDDNFTFLGYREYPFDGREGCEPAALGILSESQHPVFGGLRDLASLPPEVQDFLRRRELLLVTKTNRHATVHRDAPMDAIGVRRFGPAGEVVGIRIFVGLFTSLAYSRNPRSIPLIRLKVSRIMARSGLPPNSHDGKALLHILDTFPRDELFQIAEDELYDTVTGILGLQERQRIALFLRSDPLERFVSCLVCVPRDRYDAELRQAFAEILASAFAGAVSGVHTHFDESALGWVQFIIRTTRGAVPPVDRSALEARLAEAGRSWSERVEKAAAAAFGEAEGASRLRRVATFPIAYQLRTSPAQALADLGRIAAVLAGSPLEVSLHAREEGDAPGLRLYRVGEPLPLSDVLPLLENLGLRIIAEEPFRIDTDDGTAVWVHELTLAPGGIGGGLAPLNAARFEEALVAVWTGRVESDGLNRLVLAAGLSARQVVILRLYTKLLRQAGSGYSQAYMEDTLAGHAEIAARLVRLFELRFDPNRAAGPLDGMAEIQAIDHGLDAVDSLDEDRMLRSYLTLVLKTVRTNYYQPLPSGEPKPYLAVKLASSAIELLPPPRPLFEIYVYSPRVEGLHLRAGKVARGGIRWSDRKEDFRTEILGLMKAQTVKNAVIVPVGAKGGFVVKRPPATADRDALTAEAIACYSTLMRGLLDLTDNIVPDAAGRARVVSPPAVMRHDEDDPYLVVAADKGTASFSDIANGIAAEYGFWLGDAFASGGSKGYDHKEMGITSRGAWESIKRHFRELGRDIDSAAFTVVGVGDMSGDVFGNGMLRSRQTRLLAAFNHLHIFVDPDPDPEASFAERQRLFDLPRSSWSDYDPGLISPGGGVFARNAKSIALSPQIKAAFGIEQDHLTPAELVRTLLTAAVDLLWFGGIGTFVKARAETQAAVGDRANDPLRVDAEALRAAVIGEGANLGVTQRGRIAYALRGGRIDTDAIDNSAGVDTSDHEVNIKVLLEGAIAAGTLARAEREPLLARMTEEVAALVLRDNYLQGEALSVAEARGPAALDRQARVLRELERAGRLDRALEFLPDDETLATRAAARQGLVRPELAVLLAYAKMALDEELLASDLPDLPDYLDELRAYFPSALRERFAAQIAAHPLRREIIATAATNELVNRAGLTFVHDMRARTGRGATEIAQAFRVVRTVFRLPELWAEIEALDNAVPAATQTEMLLDVAGLVEHASAWLLRANRIDLAAETARFALPLRQLTVRLSGVLPPAEQNMLAARASRLAEAAVPGVLAEGIAALPLLAAGLEIADLAARTKSAVETAGRTYYAVGARFALDQMRAAARRLPAETSWQKLAVETVIDDFFAVQAAFAERVLAEAGPGTLDPLAAWAATRAAMLAPVEALAAELRADAIPDLAMLVVAGRQLRQALG